MPIDCSNSWQAYWCDWTVGHLWRSSDLIERFIFVTLAFMLAYTVVVFGRFCRRYFAARRECQSNLILSEGHKRKIVVNLAAEITTLRSIASTAPFLGLAGTCYGITGGFRGVGMLKSIAEALMSAEVASALVTTAGGIVVAIPAILAYNLLQVRFEGVKSELARGKDAASTDTVLTSPSFRYAQTLPLQSPFSRLPPFALVAAPVLASVVAAFAFFEPYESPKGLPVWLMRMGALDELQSRATPVRISLLRASNSDSVVVRLNSKEIPLENLDVAAIPKIGLSSRRKVYVEAEGALQWTDIIRVLDVVRGSDAEVVLLTTTPHR